MKQGYRRFTDTEIIKTKDVIREFITANPNAKLRHIAAHLNERGVSHPNYPLWRGEQVNSFLDTHPVRKTALTTANKVTTAIAATETETAEDILLAEAIITSNLTMESKRRFLGMIFSTTR